MLLENENNIMVDIETMDLSTNAAIVSIGAVRFSKDGIVDTFHLPVSLKSSMKVGLKISSETIMWWLKQDQNTSAFFVDAKDTLHGVLREFNYFVKEDSQIWGNGSDFDNAILTNAYKKCGIEPKWEYYDNMCYRTISNLFKHLGEDYVHPTIPHNALEDARSQALYLIKLCNHINAGMHSL